MRFKLTILLLLFSTSTAIAVAQSGRKQITKPSPPVEKNTSSNETQPVSSKVAPTVKTATEKIPPDLSLQVEPMITRVEAHAGVPFGIGRLSFRLRPEDEMTLRVGGTLLTEQNNRIYYPVLTRSAMNSFLENISGRRDSSTSNQHSILFLFKGEQPLNLRLEGTAPTFQTIQIETQKPKRFERFLKIWWRELNKMAERQMNWGDYPGVIETYLTSMLSRRMAMPIPRRYQRKRDQLAKTFDLLFDVETLRTDAIRRAMAGLADNTVANQPLPPPIQWAPTTPAILIDAPKIEPIVKCVPEECFYLRFGTWQNQLWLQQLMEEFGGDLSRMIQLRGYKPKIQSKFLDQLAIQSSELDRLFGGRLIDDVAVIGMDAYFDEGASVGVLLHAIDSPRLEANLKKKRKTFVKDHEQDGAKLVETEHDGVTIQYLATPDNRYRSFYVVHDNCHLTTTSLKMAQRFIEASNGTRSLSDNADFRFARQNMPLSRDDTVFIYLSKPFFQQLLSPQYQIELQRRNRVISDMQLLEAARLAGSYEGLNVDNINNLIEFGFLPDQFGIRPDNSQAIITRDKWLDTIRGRRGFFAPIADMKVETVTQDEFNWFHERATFFSENVRSLDPMLVAIKRYQHKEKKNVERVVFDARVAPFGEEKYGWLVDMLGPSLKQKVAGSPQDIISFQASLRKSGRNREVLDHQVFAAIQDDIDPNVNLKPTTTLKLLQTLRETPAYLGAWPKPGYLDWLPSLGAQPDQYGYTYSRMLNLWRLQWEDFSVVGFDQNRLERLKPTLKIVPSKRPAQIRLTIGDLRESKLKNWANAVNYRRSWETSIANVRLLNMLTQQFGISPEISRNVAEKMLNVDLVCSLGGEYKLYQIPSGRKLWASSDWPSFIHPHMPADYLAPVLSWFRGSEIEISKTDAQFSVHGYLDVERDPAESKMKLPSFDVFGGFNKLFGGSEQKKAQDPNSSKDGNE